jgi:hypothetical protein
MPDQIISNIFLTDENVGGPAIRIARARGVQIIRDADLDLDCELDDYDQCLFEYAVENAYVLVTNNIKHFEPKFYKYAESGRDHPGLILIQNQHRSNSTLIADWLDLWSDFDFTNRIERI